MSEYDWRYEFKLKVYGAMAFPRGVWTMRPMFNSRPYMTVPRIKPIETFYKGYRFRSRLEARWAVFFDACGVKWEYEPEGYDLGNGMYYLPDFLLHNVAGRVGGDLFVEVKGHMTPKDAEKIKRFVRCGGCRDNRYTYENAILLVGNIPEGDTLLDIDNYIESFGYKGPSPFFFNFDNIDGDCYIAFPGINTKGKFELFGADGNYLCERDPVATERAYRLARQARFEHGEKGAKQ